jgi:phenylacetate-CoA ligase
VQVGSIGRLDDVKKIKGVNVNPQVVDDVIYRSQGVLEYQVVIGHTADLADVVALKLVPTAGIAADKYSTLLEQLQTELQRRTGIHFQAEIVEDLPRASYKIRRWLDERKR